MSKKQPNILLITTDQQRHDTLGQHKPEFLRTPHLDQLAAQGVTFNRAYADCPMCVPSRMSIMTGNTVLGHGMTEMGKTGEFLGRANTLPSRLHQQGYHTAAIGKMHFHPQRTRHGFDEMILPEDYYRAARNRGDYLLPMRHGLGQNELYPGLATVPESQTLTAWTVEQSVDYLLERRDPTTPFFLWCSFSKPHPPLDPPEPYYSMYQNSAIPEPIIGDWAEGEACPAALLRDRYGRSYDKMSDETIRAARAAYYGLITQIDYNLGRLFAALAEAGIDENTLILFTSDHGEFLGDHGTGGKRHFHEASSHIPMILRLPPTWESSHYGASDDSLVTLADILPTCVEAAGARADDIDGQSLISLVNGTLDQSRDILLAITGPADPGKMPLYMGLTDGDWKYIWYPEGPTEQLFNLAEDPYEARDLSEKPDLQPQRDRFRQYLKEQMKDNAPGRLSGGELPEIPDRTVNAEATRYRNRLGLHTEYLDRDIRH